MKEVPVPVPSLVDRWRLTKRHRLWLTLTSLGPVVVWLGFGVFFLATHKPWLAAAYGVTSLFFIWRFVKALRRYLVAGKVVQALGWIEPYWKDGVVSASTLKGHCAIEQFEAFCAKYPEVNLCVSKVVKRDS